MPNRFRYLCLCGALLLVPDVASAQATLPRHDVPLAQALSGPAKEAYASATLLFHNGDFTGAAAKYDQAHQLSGDPRLLFNIAICEKNLRAYARMQKYLQQYEREAGAGISAEGKASADAALAATANLVGALTIVTNVAGATVKIDGEVAGTSPLDGPLVVDLGKHTVSVQKAGFEVASATVEMTGGSSSTTTLTLVPEVHTGQLSIVADSGATIVIDGRTSATGRFDGKLDAGHHQVTVTAPGKVAYEADIDLRERETRTLEITLVSEKKGGVIWPWVAGGAALAAGAAVGGYFLFRPTDHTLGVPQGTLGGVDGMPSPADANFMDWRFRRR